MKTTTLVLLLAIVLSACAPAVTPTPTPIPPTATPVPPTATPVPPPTLSSPSDTKAIVEGNNPPSTLGSLATEEYSEADLQQVNRTFPYTIQLASNLRALWEAGWCATTQAILDQNMKQMTFAFSMNGQPVAPSQFYEVTFEGTDESGKAVACHAWGTVVSNWPKGAATVLQTVQTIASKINNGRSDYDAGQQTFIYTVTLP